MVRGADSRPPDRDLRVEVTLKGSLAARLPGGHGPVNVVEGASVGSLLAMFGIPDVHCIYVVNGSAVTRDALLRDGDRVQIFPPMAGG